MILKKLGCLSLSRQEDQGQELFDRNSQLNSVVKETLQ